MADITTNVEIVKISQKSVIVTEHVEYPEPRMTVDSGSIANAGDMVKVFLKIFDKNQIQKGDTKVLIVKFTDLPVDTSKEVLGAITVSFVESTKPV